jgi:hypothetical protein
MSDIEQEQQSTEETAEVEAESTETVEQTDGEGEGSEGTDQETEEAPELAKARKVAEDQRKRAEKAEAELKKLKGPGKESRAPNKDGKGLSDEDSTRLARSEERSERAALRSMGITHPEDIQYVRDAAKRLGIDVEEAAEDEFIKARLERKQAVRKTKEATPDPSRRGGSQARNTKLPNFSKMSDEEFDKWEKENRR